jgi:hypothetical protein
MAASRRPGFGSVAVTSVLMVLLTVTGCAAPTDEPDHNGPSTPITGVGHDPRILVFTEDVGLVNVEVTGVLRPDPATGCLVLESADGTIESVVVWPFGSEPVNLQGTAGARVPDVGVFLEGDQLHVAGALVASPEEESYPRAVGECLRDDLALTYTVEIDVAAAQGRSGSP